MSVYVSPDQLELLLQGECRCVMGHGEACPMCSVVVVALFFTKCGVVYQICANAEAYFRESLLTPDLCLKCDQPVRNCWAVRTI